MEYGLALLGIIGVQDPTLRRVGRPDEHVNGERFIDQRSHHFGFGVGVIISVKMERHIGGDASLVGNTDDLEVIILIKVVTGNRFVEPQD